MFFKIWFSFFMIPIININWFGIIHCNENIFLKEPPILWERSFNLTTDFQLIPLVYQYTFPCHVFYDKAVEETEEYFLKWCQQLVTDKFESNFQEMCDQPLKPLAKRRKRGNNITRIHNL
jgi:hypothetical protein